MRFDVITLFPEVIEAYVQTSIIGRAVQKKVISVKTHQLRDFSRRKWKQVDDRPYGGGPGMVLEVDSLVRAIDSIKRNLERQKRDKKSTMIYHSKKSPQRGVKIVITSPAGKLLTNAYAKNLAKKYENVIIVAGHYEGIDARVGKIFSAGGGSASGGKVDYVSTGPYVLTGGEVPALAIIDATARQIPGVLGKFESLEEGRVSTSEVYTRPETYLYKGKKYRVPKVLLSGHHTKIEEWKRKRRKVGKKA